MKSDKAPAPNMKNKKFLEWQRAESFKKDEDNLVSSDWHEKLRRMGRFVPDYDNAPVNMVYLMSGEYGRLWMKQRDEWFKSSYASDPRVLDFLKRQEKIRKAAKAEKKEAQAKALERKKRREKEIEAKEKAKAEELEKLRERVRQRAAAKKPSKTAKARKNSISETRPSSVQEETTDEKVYSEGPKQVESPLQNECSDKDNKETNEEVKGEQNVPAAKDIEEQSVSAAEETEDSKGGCVMCDEYLDQMKIIHNKNLKEAIEECERGAQ